MQANGFFSEAGQIIGDIIRAVVEFLLAIFTNFFGALEDFVDGLSRSLVSTPHFSVFLYW